MKTISVKELPESMKAIVKRMGYRKHKVMISEADAITCHGTYWSGGSKSNYHSVDSKGRIMPVITPISPREFGGDEPPRVQVPEQGYIIQTGIFCGKTATMIIYRRIEDTIP